MWLPHRHVPLLLEGTFYVRQLTSWAKDLRVTADGDDVVAMVGVIGLRMIADRTGLTGGLSAVLAKPGFDPVHDRGRVLVDIACSIAAGGADVYDIEALRAQGEVLGPVASDTTALRALGEIGDRDLHRMDVAGAKARAHLWGLLPGGVPVSRFAGGHDCGQTIVLRVDATISIAHSGKQNAAGTLKKTFGFHPLGCWIDNTRELAALMLRPGNAGANTAADLIEVIRAAMAQIPVDRRDNLLITSDGAAPPAPELQPTSQKNGATPDDQVTVQGTSTPVPRGGLWLKADRGPTTLAELHHAREGRLDQPAIRVKR
jgi:hypothetical protein